MARKIRFPLIMKNGIEVRTLDELKEYFDIEAIIGYFTDGKLVSWLADRYYDDKAEAVSSLSADTPDLNRKLCEILEVEYKETDEFTDLEYIKQRNRKIRIIKENTDDINLVNNPDLVATDSKELFDMIDKSSDKVYLLGEKFSIPIGTPKISYIGVNNPTIFLESNKTLIDYDEAGITFQNVKYGGLSNYYFTKGEQFYIQNKFEKALPLIKEAAEKNNPRAMCIYAMMQIDLYNNKDEARKWLEKAYPFKEPVSTANYAYWCCSDNKEKQMEILDSVSHSLKFLADNNDFLALFEYSYYLVSYGKTETEKQEGFNNLIESPLNSFIPAYKIIGCCYYCGKGVEIDYEEAVEWYTKSALQGNPVAQNALGNCYYRGKGVEFDYEEAVEWYFKAANQGSDWGKYNLGYCYYNGIGVSMDTDYAIKLYRESAKMGNPIAKKALLGKSFDFGWYEGDYLTWTILSIDEDSMYVLCDDTICNKEFDESEDESNDWIDSTLRKWLNNDFYDEAFDEDDKECIKEVNSDKVTLLSIEDVFLESKLLYTINEIRKYESDADEVIDYLKHLEKKNLVSEQDLTICFDGWLRSASPGSSNRVWYVWSDGSLDFHGCVSALGGVRPALNLEL